jgi:hypothetical protein
VLLPRFAETGLVTLINIASPTLECKIELTEEEIEVERARTAVVRSDLDIMNEEGGEW